MCQSISEPNNTGMKTVHSESLPFVSELADCWLLQHEKTLVNVVPLHACYQLIYYSARVRCS